MKTYASQVIGKSVALLLGLGVLCPALALSSFSGDLGVLPTATDIWEFTCPDGTAEARGIVQDVSPAAAPRVRLGLLKDVTLLVVEAPNEGVSGTLVQPSGPGTYWAIFMKTAAPDETYEARVGCFSATGADLGAFGLAQTQDE